MDGVLTAAGSLVLLAGVPVAMYWIAKSARTGPRSRTVFLSLALVVGVTAAGAWVGGPVGRVAVNVGGLLLVLGALAVLVALVTPAGWVLLGAGVRRAQSHVQEREPGAQSRHATARTPADPGAHPPLG